MTTISLIEIKIMHGRINSVHTDIYGDKDSKLIRKILFLIEDLAVKKETNQ